MTRRDRSTHFIRVAVIALAAATALAGCGGSEPARSANARTTAPDPSPSKVVVRVGSVPITEATYGHWMAIGAATIEMPKPTGPLPKPIDYVPPAFARCVASTRRATPSIPTVVARQGCEATYRNIQRRILYFLISGYWLRQQARIEHIAIRHSTISKALLRERERDGAIAYRRLVSASHQTVPDLDFAIETRLLSERLEQHFIAAHKHLSERAQIAGFNKELEGRWVPVTDCARGYVVRGCHEFRAKVATP